jgi:hypothetical protein
LCQGDVAAVSEGCDTQAAAVANVLIVVLDLSITDVDLAVLGLLILLVPVACNQKMQHISMYAIIGKAERYCAYKLLTQTHAFNPADRMIHTFI